MAALLDTTDGATGVASTHAPDSWSLSIVTSLDDLSSSWRALENGAAVSPYQRFDMTAAWCRHAAAGARVEPRVGVVRDEDGRVVMILPLGLTRRAGLRIATYLGGSHFNLNMPLVDPAFPLPGERLLELLDRYCELTDADLLCLSFQPRAWRDRPHPFLQLRHNAATADVRTVRIGGTFRDYVESQLSKSMQSKLRRKRQRFGAPGSPVGVQARTAEDVRRHLAAFLDQRATQFAVQGIHNPFAEPGVAEFLQQAALAALDGNGGLEFHALEVDGAPVSIRAGVTHRDHHSLMIQSFDTSHPLAKFSPSEVLVMNILESARDRAITEFDFGVGDGQHKKVWSNGVADLFDVTYAASAKGFVYAALMRWRTRVVRFIKHNDTLFGWFKALRAWSGRRARRAAPEA